MDQGSEVLDFGEVQLLLQGNSGMSWLCGRYSSPVIIIIVSERVAGICVGPLRGDSTSVAALSSLHTVTVIGTSCTLCRDSCHASTFSEELTVVNSQHF